MMYVRVQCAVQSIHDIVVAVRCNYYVGSTNVYIVIFVL